MSDRPTETEAVPSKRATTPASRRWLLLAIASTVIATVFLGYALFAMFQGVNPDKRSPVALSEAAMGDQLVLAIGRTPGGQAEWANYVVLMRYMQDRIGRPIKVRYIADRESASGIFENGEAVGGFLCTRSYLLLEKKGVVRAIAVPVTSGACTETAMVFVRADSAFHTFEDLKGGSVAISSKTSVSGAAYLYWLADQKGLTVDTFFSTIDVSPTQEDGLRKLSEGSVDAAVGCSTEARLYPPGTFRAVATSPEYALPPFVVSTSMDQETVDALLEALMSFDAHASLPADSVLDGFEPVTSADYDFSRQLLKYIPAGDSE